MYKYIKRIFDVVFSFFAILIFLIPMIIVAVIIKCESKGPVIFKQKRIGKNKKEFYIYKFRTMRSDTPSNVPTHLLQSSENYITKSGAFFRKTSIDELPQFFNILKGDMSIIGPRPALWNQYDLIKERDKFNANNCLPGLTGLAQINGRDELEIKKKAEFDGEYVKNISFFTDLKILLLTVKSVFKGEGVREGKIDKNFNKNKC